MYLYNKKTRGDSANEKHIMDLFAFPGKTYRTEAPDEAVYEAAVFPVSNQKIWIFKPAVYITAGFVI